MESQSDINRYPQSQFRRSVVLATSDRGIAMFRRLLKEATQAVARGEDPPGILRDPTQVIVPVGARNEVRAPAE